MLFTLQDGSKLNIRKRSDIASTTPMYHGIITKEVDYTENEYYDLLKENNLPIPLDQEVFVQRDGIIGGKKTAKNIGNNNIVNNIDNIHSNMTKYKLKNGQTLYVSTHCLETFPCQHECIFNDKKMMMSGNAIKNLLENHELTFVHN
jgi:hypothetical protein